MKKLICALLALTLTLALTACGTTAPEQTQTPTAEPTEPGLVIEGTDKLLSTIWADMGEEEKYYVGGGDSEHAVENDAGLVTDADYMTYNLHLPEDLHSQVTEVASLVHGMNLNSMTAAAYRLTEGADAAAFAKELRAAIQSTQWMCGFPERLYIASVADCVLVVYGLTDNVTSIEGHFARLYPSAEELYAEPLYKEAIEG